MSEPIILPHPCDIGDVELDHDWEYYGGDYSVGINPCWICTRCGATDTDSPPPDDDY